MQLDVFLFAFFTMKIIGLPCSIGHMTCSLPVLGGICEQNYLVNLKLSFLCNMVSSNFKP